MLAPWKTRRGRRAAAAQIIPLVDGTRRRLGGIPDAAWRDPYIVGFLAMLITLIARRSAGALGRDDLALIQSRAWADITGMPADLFGEEVCYYDAARDRRFASGCRNAELFFRGLDMVKRASEEELGGGAASARFAEADAGAVLWSRYFDAHLGGSGTDAQP
ncbi:MAG: hypothetical protein IRY89_12680 [Pseudolabrys sp.]|nr:hypothetical protein [Pseudolabrys sp.]